MSFLTEDQMLTPREILQYMMFVLLKRKWQILFLFVFTTVAIIGATFLFTPMWLATCKLLVQSNPTQQMIVFDEIESPGHVDPSSFAPDLVEMLVSEEFAGKIVKEFKLDEEKKRKAKEPADLRERLKLMIGKAATSPITLIQWLGILPYAEKTDFFADAVDDFINDYVAIEMVEGTSTIALGIYAESPEMAIAISNRMKEMLLERVRNFEQSEAEQTYEFVKMHLDTVSKSLEDAENQLLAFQNENEVADFAAQSSQTLANWDQVQEELEANEKSLAATKAKLFELERQLAPPQLVTTAGGPAVDEYLRFRNSLDEQKLEQELLNARTSLAEMLASNGVLEKSRDQLKVDMDKLASTEMQLQQLTREVVALNDRYTTMHKRFLELEVQKFTQTPEYDIQVLAEPYIPPGWDYDFPNMFIAVIAALVSAVSVALGYALFMEYWLDPVQSPKQIEQLMPVAGVVPKYQAGGLVGQFRPRKREKPKPAGE